MRWGIVASPRGGDRELRSIVEQEVTKQMKPFADQMKKVHDWQLGFWSNGSGRPPGFFQMRMKEDDERNQQVKEDLAKATAVAARLDDFVNEQRILREHRQARWRFWWPIIKWVGGGLGTTVLGLAVWACAHIAPVVRILWEDYLKYHPGVTQQLKNVSADDNPAVVSEENIQAGGRTGTR
jgi:hypothetical protein